VNPETPGDARFEAVRDVLRAMSRTPFDVDAILQTMCEHAVRLCHADFGYVFVPEDGHLRVAGSSQAPAEMLAYIREHPPEVDRRTGTGRAMLEGREVQIEDVEQDPEWQYEAARERGPYRATMSVPLQKEHRILGVFSVARREPGPFDEGDVELVRTFADQAALVVDNVALLRTVERQREELAHFMPSTVARLVSSPDGARLLAAHRRDITAVFCDIRGFTGFAEISEPEEVLEILRHYQLEMGRLVLAHRGTIEHYAGDGIMSFLNDPEPVEDHPRAAVAMALEMRDRFAELAAGWRRGGVDLGIGIGISTGFATVGRVGFEGYYLYAATGSVPNMAARLGGVALPGQVLISARGYGRVESAVKAEPLGAFELKGFRRPVEAYLVTALGEAGSVAAPS
jgi:class 3 adenylate cyclase